MLAKMPALSTVCVSVMTSFRLTVAASLCALTLCSVSAMAQTVPAHTATLAGHAILPALSVLPAPADAPADLRSSGKFTTTPPTYALGTVEGKSDGRPTGVKLPFDGQPRQGHSGIVRMDDVAWWLMRKPSTLAQSLGRGLIALTPWLMKALSVVGTAAMFLVGGSLLVHGMAPLQAWVDAVLLPRGGLVAALAPVLVHVVTGAAVGAVVVLVVEGFKRARAP